MSCPPTATQWGVEYEVTNGSVTVWMSPPLRGGGYAATHGAPHREHLLMPAWTTFEDLEASPVTTEQLRALLDAVGAAGAETLGNLTVAEGSRLATAYRALAAAIAP